MNRQPISLEADPLQGAPVLIVVARGEDSLYRYTSATFEREPAVEVIVDRRYQERRQRVSVPSVERRQRDRRGPQRVELLKAQGWLIIRRQPNSASH